MRIRVSKNPKQKILKRNWLAKGELLPVISPFLGRSMFESTIYYLENWLFQRYLVQDVWRHIVDLKAMF